MTDVRKLKKDIEIIRKALYIQQGNPEEEKNLREGLELLRSYEENVKRATRGMTPKEKAEWDCAQAKAVAKDYVEGKLEP